MLDSPDVLGNVLVIGDPSVRSALRKACPFGVFTGVSPRAPLSANLGFVAVKILLTPFNGGLKTGLSSISA